MTQAGPLSICLAGHVGHGKSSLLRGLVHELRCIPGGNVAAPDAMRVRLGTPRGELLVTDAPGHRELVSHLVTGAAHTQAALLVVDAQSGAQQQTRSHLALLALLGVRYVVVAVNKMDVVDWSCERYEAVASAVSEATKRLGLVAHAIVPVSARVGANLVHAAEALAWWGGPTLVAALDGLPADDAQALRGGPLRMPVQDVHRIGERRIVAGRMQSGTLALGDTVLVLPSGRSARVSAFEGRPQPAPRADTGDNVAVQLDAPLVVQRGDLLCDPDAAPKLTAVFDADVVWLGSGALQAGRRIDVAIGTREVGARVAAIHHVRDMDSLAETVRDSVAEGEVARVTIRCDVPVAVDDAATLRATGSFVIAEAGLVVGGGTIDASGYPDQRHARGGRSDHVVAVRHQVDPRERARRAGHTGGVVWLTGLSGAGKSTLAMALERRLFDLGWSVYTLDGDNVRGGLNADLGFAPEDRQENIRRIGEVAALFADAGVVCITAFISPYRDDRQRARAAAGERRFLEVFVASDLATCEARDPKGLYRKARSGEIRGMTGIDSPYEPPDAPDVVIDSATRPIEACVEQLLAATLARLAGWPAGEIVD